MPTNRPLRSPKVNFVAVDTRRRIVTLSLVVLVRSFGTEDRPTDRPVPARDEIFEYIIFRGADIEDLQVREPPSGSLTQDPAIVEVRSPTSDSTRALPLAAFSVIGLRRPCSFKQRWNQHQSHR